MENWRQLVKFITVADVGDLTGSLNRPLANVVLFLMRTTKEIVVKSCVEVPEYFYNFVSYSDDELVSRFFIVWSFCFVFFSVFARRDEEGMLGFLVTTFFWEVFRQKFWMNTLKSGFRKAYISGFISELVATVKSEMMTKTPGLRSGRTKILFTVVKYKIGNQESKNAVEAMQKTFATWASDEIRRRSFLCSLADSKSFLIDKLCRTSLNIRT